MVQHKIQSSTGLTLELEQVPKMLGKLVNEWAPHAYVVSFKLETDESILFAKAWGAITKYEVHLVVANILTTRADKCYLVEPVDGHHPNTLGDQHRVVDTVDGRQRSITTVERQSDMSQIEPILVHKVVQAYWAHLGHKQVHGPAGKSMDGAREECISERIRDLAIDYVQIITYPQNTLEHVIPEDSLVKNPYVLPLSLACLWVGTLGVAYFYGTLHHRDLTLR